MSAHAEAVPRVGADTGRAARAALWLVSAVPVLVYLVDAVQRVGYPYELTFFEGSTVEVTARVVDGQPLYAAPTTAFTPWPYPPLYFWLTGLVAKVLGVNLLSLRLVSFLASLAMLTLAGVIVRRTGASRLAAAVAVGLFAATYRVSGAWFDTARVDSLLLALLLAAVLVGMRARTWRGGLGVGLLFFAAFLTKQNALVVAAPVLLFLVWRRRSAGLWGLASLTATVVGSTLVGNALTGGWYSRYVVSQLLGQDADLRWLWAFPVLDLVYPFAVSLLVVAGVLLWRRPGRAWREWQHLGSGGDVAYLLAAGIGMLATAWVSRLHEGGYANVVMPAHAAFAVGVGLLADRALRSPWCRPAVVSAFAVFMLLQLALMTSFRFRVVPTAEDRAAGDRFVASLRELPRGVLVPTHPYYLRLAGLPTHASAIAVHDLWRSRGGPETLDRMLPWSLDGVSAVVLDNENDEPMFGDALSREFTLTTTTFAPVDAFFPVSDLATHPSRLYLRNGR